MKITLLPKNTEEVIVGSDFIVIRDESMMQSLRDLKNPPESLKGKLIIVAPDGVEFIGIQELERALEAAKRKKGIKP